jgi:hypothetical protein
LKWQHTCRNDRDVIQPGVHQSLWRIRQSVSVCSVISVSHTKLLPIRRTKSPKA